MPHPTHLSIHSSSIQVPKHHTTHTLLTTHSLPYGPHCPAPFLNFNNKSIFASIHSNCPTTSPLTQFPNPFNATHDIEIFIIQYYPFTLQHYWWPKWTNNVQLFYEQFCHFVSENCKITPLFKMKQRLSPQPNDTNQSAQMASLHKQLEGLGSGLLKLILYLCVITIFWGLMELKVVKI